MEREPVAVIGAIMAVVSALITFGVLTWSAAEVDAFEQALLALAPVVVILVGAYAQRRQVYSPHTVRTRYVQVVEDDDDGDE